MKYLVSTEITARFPPGQSGQALGGGSSAAMPGGERQAMSDVWWFNYMGETHPQAERIPLPPQEEGKQTPVTQQQSVHRHCQTRFLKK